MSTTYLTSPARASAARKATASEPPPGLLDLLQLATASIKLALVVVQEICDLLGYPRPPSTSDDPERSVRSIGRSIPIVAQYNLNRGVMSSVVPMHSAFVSLELASRNSTNSSGP